MHFLTTLVVVVVVVRAPYLMYLSDRDEMRWDDRKMKGRQLAGLTLINSVSVV